MFCTTCGKQIIDTARFCNYCGSPVAAVFTQSNTPVPPVQAPIENSPVSAPIENSPVSAPENGLFEDTKTAPETDTELDNSQIPGSELISNEQQTLVQPVETNENAEPNGQNAAYSEEAAFEQVSAAVPEPSVNAQPAAQSAPFTEAANGYSLPVPNQIPINGENTANVIPEPTDQIKPLPERKYTIGHIMMCLSATAIMAIVAGVFAGLYFSVV